MKTSHAERWSAAASDWAETWGALARGPGTTLIDAVSLVPGERVLDVGCGSGELLQQLSRVGAQVAGADPADGMLELARRANPGVEIRRGGFGSLPWPDASFDVVLAINALQFADEMVGGLREAARVVSPGGRIGIANWAETHHNDIETIEAALEGAGSATDEDYRRDGGHARLFEKAGLTLVAAGLVAADWHAPDDETLIRGVLAGQAGVRSATRDTAILRAARPFANADGYVVRNAFRFAVGRRPPIM